jgi:integrase/recombinase XerD
MSGPTTLLPFQPATATGGLERCLSWPATPAALTACTPTSCGSGSPGASPTGWTPWSGSRAHVELYIRGLGDRGLMDSSVVTMMHAARGYFRFAHIDGLISSDPAVYARLPKIPLWKQASADSPLARGPGV